ncbi:MAG: hypothetical protein WBK08_18535 [Nitrospira sp.]|nr:MAG: hypothetical protein E8D42_05260 [Nitrospira sp.]
MKHHSVERHTHLQLNQVKLMCTKTVLGTKTETEAIECALALVVEEHRGPCRRWLMLFLLTFKGLL